MDTRFSFYKNTLYKNIEAENDSKIKNIRRICSGSTLLSRFENLWSPIYNLRTDILVLSLRLVSSVLLICRLITFIDVL